MNEPRIPRPLERTAVLVLLLAGAAGCAAPAPRDAAGEPLVPVLAGGDFVPDGWVDVPAFDRLRSDRERRFVPATLLALDSGWARTEDWGVYSLGDAATLDLFLQDDQPRELVIDYSLPPTPKARPIDVTVAVNDIALEGFHAPDAEWRRARLAVPPGALHAGFNRITLHHSGYLNLGTRDTRPLALGVRRIGLLPVGRSFTGDVEPVADSVLPYKVDAARDALILLSPGAFVVPYEVPAGGAVWHFALRAARWHGAGERLRVFADSLDGERHELGRFSADGDVGIDLAPYAGRKLVIAFETQPPAGGRLELRTPRVESPPSPGPPAPAAAPPDGAPRPHVLLIILDALRPDHLGSYGYDRATAPILDALARSGSVFDHVVAECPYTVCSSPTILTGLPFTRHGVTALGKRTAEEVEPLAERLAARGYRTIGFSGNPNNSAATGADQGFAEFYETWRIFWRGGEARQRWHPEVLTDLVIGRLEKGTDGAPSLVMVHYVPPHEPYAPDPTFDVFGARGYSGEVVVDAQRTKARFSGALGLDIADHDELVSLYDGNLLQADHHLGRLFDAYRRAGIWDDTLVIVTSDHGEGFAEHRGIYGHNELLYRTMLDVPLIVRLPPSLRAPKPETGRFTSLASLVPTVLGRLGEEAPVAVVGSDLFGAPPPGDFVVVQRSAHEDIPYFGLQTSRYKAMVRFKRFAALYDWRADAAEAHDLSDRQPYLWTGMVSMIEVALDTADVSEEAPISEEDRKMLESLGYAG